MFGLVLKLEEVLSKFAIEWVVFMHLESSVPSVRTKIEPNLSKPNSLGSCLWKSTDRFQFSRSRTSTGTEDGSVPPGPAYWLADCTVRPIYLKKHTGRFELTGHSRHIFRRQASPAVSFGPQKIKTHKVAQNGSVRSMTGFVLKMYSFINSIKMGHCFINNN